jgi:hypothetical protein
VEGELDGEGGFGRESELKEDVILIQFKLVDKRSFKSLNTFSFINIPFSKILDVNVSTLLEILNKFKRNCGEMKQGKGKSQNEFIPYNKSILTRVVAEQLQKNNVLVLSHFSRNSIQTYFKHGTGSAKGLFNQIDHLFGDKPSILLRKKLNDQQALKLLQKKFKSETQQIFN